jgi:Arc/MetJ-type ribon-helix-helix transcriptional regulator
MEGACASLLSAMDKQTLAVSVSAELVDAVRERVAAEGWPSADELIEQALWDWLWDRDETPEMRASMGERIREALTDPRPSVPMEDVFDRLLDRLRGARTKDE